MARASILAVLIVTIIGSANGATGPANRLRQGYDGPPKLYAKAEAGPHVRRVQHSQGRVQQGTGQASQAQPPATFRTEANYVRVDAFPTANGAPVLDLSRDDFEVLEDNVRQTIEAFEHVIIRSAGPQETRDEPNTVAQSRAMLENARARVFVLFLDHYHVGVAGSSSMRKLLVEALDRATGPEDLIGVMTPEMSATDVTFARRTTTIAGLLERHWTWGERDQILGNDPEEEAYRRCYARSRPRGAEIAEEMIERRREKRTIDALHDLVRLLRGVREERKAVLVISEGWRLFRPDSRLARALDDSVPGTPRVFVDPRTGRPTTTDWTGTTMYECDRDRMHLAQIDNDQLFRDVLDEANRSNASFYPVDPRGLVVFDEPVMKLGRAGPPAPAEPPSLDRARLQARLDSLRALAADTDGMAMVQTNDLAGGLNRIVDDLSSYYLLGYYSTGKLDGKFHSIRVRVKRPGVQVRARRGYRAPTAAEVTAAARRASRDSAATSEVELASSRAIESALAPLNAYSRERLLRVDAAAGWTPANTAAVWAFGELSASQEWKAGAEIDVTLVDRSGRTRADARVELAAGVRGFRTLLAAAEPLAPGDYVVRTRARGRLPDPSVSTDTLSISLHAAPSATRAVFVRRGPTTGNREIATADLRFRRSEQLRIDVPAPAGEGAAARLLDRTGQPLQVPVTTAIRDDADGSRWQTAQLTLAPLAPGDYVIELTKGQSEQAGTARTLFAFRIVP